MKALFLLAVFLCAANSSLLPELFQVVVSNLQMGPERTKIVLKNGVNCIDSVGRYIAPLIEGIPRDFEEKNFIKILQNILTVEEIFEHQIVPQCYTVYQEIHNFLKENSNSKGASKINFRNQFNVMIFLAHERQLLAEIIKAVIMEDMHLAGKKVAQFLKEEFGLVDFDIPQVYPYINEYEITTKSKETIRREFCLSFFRELGAGEKEINNYASCVNDFVETTQKAFMNPSVYRGDSLTRFSAIIEGLLKMTDSLHRCEQTVDFSPIYKLFGVFMRDPARFSVQVAMNYVLEGENIALHYGNTAVHTLHGNFAEAGRSFAKDFKALFKGIVYFY